MKLSGEVKAVEKLGGMIGTDDRRLVTVRLHHAGEVRLKMTPHEARAYHVGREVDVIVQARKER